MVGVLFLGDSAKHVAGLMSEARVQFETEDFEEAAPGKEAVFSFKCPKYGHACGMLVIAGRTKQKRDPKGANGGSAQWEWDGNREAPTFSPSINCGTEKRPCWHGYIRAGRCVDTANRDEPEPKPRPSS